MVIILSFHCVVASRYTSAMEGDGTNEEKNNLLLALSRKAGVVQLITIKLGVMTIAL